MITKKRKEFEQFVLQSTNIYLAGKYARARTPWRENTYIRVKKWHKYEIFMILIRLKGYCCLNDLLYQIVLHTDL